MAKRDKYRKNRASGFFDYTEGKMSDRERHAFERRMQKDPFDADAAEGFSGVSREKAEQDLQSAAEKIRMRVEGESSRTSDNESQTGEERGISGNRNGGRKQRIGRSRRIAWYSAAAAIASLMIVTTIFFQLNNNGLERFETAPEMREAAREQAAKSKSLPLEEAEEEQKKPVEEESKDQDGPAAEEVMEQVEPVGEDGMEQDEPVQETIVEQEEVVRDDAAFPFTAGPDAKKGYDLKEMQIHEKEQTLDQKANNLAKELTVAAEDRQAAKEDRPAVEEDHAFAREKMEDEAAAGRYNAFRQRMTPAEVAIEPKTAHDIQSPIAAMDNVKREQVIAGISDQTASTVSGVVRSADDLEPLPGAVVKLRYSEKGTVADMEGRFTLDVTTNDEETLEVSYIGMKPETVRATTDQPVEIALVPDEISLDEVVVIGYGSSKKSQLTASTTAEEVEPSGTVKFESAVPANGLADFRSYIDSTLVYPEPIETSGKEVVVLKFSVAPDGRPQYFRVIRAPENEAFEKEAIRVISEGPAWQPATKNGQHTEEEVRLRIVFRKD